MSVRSLEIELPNTAISLETIREHLEALAARGFSEAVVEGDESLASRRLLGPHQGCGELERICSAQGVRGQSPGCSLSQPGRGSHDVDVFNKSCETS